MNTEPTPEFEAKCIKTVKEWASGQLPFKDAVTRLMAYSDEAAAAEEWANQARAQDRLGYIQHYRGNLNVSTEHYERARELYQQAGNHSRTANLDLNIGENYRNKGDSTMAVRLYRAAFEEAKDTNQLDVQTLAALNEGLTLVGIGQHVGAVRRFQTALNLTANWNGDRPDLLDGILCEVYSGMAMAELQARNPQAAWEAALKAWQIAKRNPLPLHVGYAYRAIGQVILALEDAPPGFDEPVDHYFSQSVAAFKEINAEAEMARTMLEQARHFARSGQRVVAVRKLQQVMIIFTRLGMISDAALAAESQRDLL